MISCTVTQFYKKSWLHYFRLGIVRIGRGQMLSTNQIAMFISWPYLKDKLMNWSDFLYNLFCVVRIGHNAIGQSDCDILESTISQEQIDESALFLHVHLRFLKKNWCNYFRSNMVRIGCACILLDLVWKCEIFQLTVSEKQTNWSIFYMVM